MNALKIKRRLLSSLVLSLLTVVTGTFNCEAKVQIKEVELAKSAFNPSRGEKLTLSYKLSQADKITILIYDPDGGLVRTLIKGAERATGSHSETWEGRDDTGQPVPNEAYTFTLETASGTVYDPTTFSGGTVGHIKEAKFHRDGTVVYKLPAPSRVLIRLGVQNGPMLKTLVDWDPRVAGVITEYWDGRDEDKLIKVRAQKNFTALITYVTLPDASVIAYGNDQETYREYKLGRGKGAAKKPDRPRRAGLEPRLRPTFLVPPAWVRAPRIVMTFPIIEAGPSNGLPQVKVAANVRIEVAPSDRDFLLSDQFEVIFFVDNVFFAEAERGYLPFNWHWELIQIPPGEHVLTVNIISFKGQVGVASRKVNVVTGP